MTERPSGESPTAPAVFRPVATYSIVVRDGRTGELGVAVQSHWFDVGAVVPWAESGVGAVATQSLVEVTYGPLGLELMRGGKTSEQALAALIASDSGQAYRQVGMIDAKGNVANHTGKLCIAHASDRTAKLDDGTVATAQANLMRHEGVPEAMIAALEESDPESPLADRLLACLRAAEAKGGDVRGRQSAALLVVAGEPSGQPWNDRKVELTVQDHAEPLDELARLLAVHTAYEHMSAGDRAIEIGDAETALAEYEAALEKASERTRAEMAFWTGISLVNAGREKDATPYFETAFADEAGDWRAVVKRLPASELFPDDAELIARIVAIGK